MGPIDYQNSHGATVPEGFVSLAPGALPVVAGRPLVGGPLAGGPLAGLPLGGPPLGGPPPVGGQDMNAWQKEEAQKGGKKVPVYQEMVKMQEKLATDVQLLENKIYEMEGNYLAATADVGNMIKGWEGYISSATKTRRPAAKTTGGASSNQDRLFSLTSITSRASRELSAWGGAEESDRQLVGSTGGKGWNNSAASQVSNSRNSACSTNVKTSKRPSSSRTGSSSSSSSSSKAVSGGRHSSGSGGGPSASSVGQKACSGSAVGEAFVGSASHGRM